MKRLLTMTLLIGAIFCFANDEQRANHGQREMRTPPQEAITACKSKSEGDSCEVESPRGDTLQGTCQNTPDGKYFACKPENMGGNKPPQR